MPLGGCSLVPPRVLVAEPQLEPEPSSHAAFLGVPVAVLVPVPTVPAGLKGEAQGRLGATEADGMAGAGEGWPWLILPRALLMRKVGATSATPLCGQP